MSNEKDECYAMLPYNAGRAWLAHLKKNRLKNLKQVFLFLLFKKYVLLCCIHVKIIIISVVLHN